jgi:hypothetical protein
MTKRMVQTIRCQVVGCLMIVRDVEGNSHGIILGPILAYVWKD